MSLKFGTSGVRGLVTAMTDRECYLYSTAFLTYLRQQEAPPVLAVAGDRRSSTPRIMKAVAAAAENTDFDVDYVGLVPTPTVAAYARKRDIACVMVTGSHIPDDRNGIKFYMPWGETLKSDEGEISERYVELKKKDLSDGLFDDDGSFIEKAGRLGPENAVAMDEYMLRYAEFFPARSLAGMKLVYYQHSAVIGDVFCKILRSLGADVMVVGQSEGFVPVDTEAVDNPDQLREWVKSHHADALVSTDGDSDRPLLVDQTGTVIRGDVLGIIVSDYLNANVVAVPVSCNTAVEKSGKFDEVIKTRIGSPYVIAAMQKASAADSADVVVGYEANGGYLTQTDIANPDSGAVMPSLPTRDAVLPILAALCKARRDGQTLSRVVADLPPRYTCSGLLREFPSELGKLVVDTLVEGGAGTVESYFGEVFGEVKEIDTTDGVRISFADDLIVHFRPSGNAPEFRCYTEAESADAAREANDQALEVLSERIRPAVAG